jgi:hypothetical protein
MIATASTPPDRRWVEQRVAEPQGETGFARDKGAVMSRDRRAADRRRIRWKALILNSAGKLVCECTIVNVSSTGARLALHEPTALPESFVLVMSRNGDVRRHCELTWYKDKTAGVHFLRPQAAEVETVSYVNDAMARFAGHHGDDYDADGAWIHDPGRPA